MNIKSLMLTEEEKLAIGIEVIFSPENTALLVPEARGRIIDRIADAATAKALWGVRDWLKGFENESNATRVFGALAQELSNVMATAGITREGEMGSI